MIKIVSQKRIIGAISRKTFFTRTLSLFSDNLGLKRLTIKKEMKLRHLFILVNGIKNKHSIEFFT